MTAATIMLGLLATACASGDDDDAAGGDEAADVAQGDDAALEESADGTADAATEGGAADVASGGDSGLDLDLGTVGREVIIEMQVTMSSDDVRATVSAISSSANALGGGVASSDIDYGDPSDDEGRDERALLVVKVPPSALDRFLGGLEDEGVVRSIDQSAQDVTEQLVDLDVRITNMRRSVDNVRELMERAEDLTDLVLLEDELTRRQTELERLLAQQRNIEERVAFSTITIEVVATATVPVEDDDDGIADAFRTGWDAFVGLLFGIAFALAVLAPFLVVVALVGGAGWLLVRSRRRRGRSDATLNGPRPTETVPPPPSVSPAGDATEDREPASPAP